MPNVVFVKGAVRTYLVPLVESVIARLVVFAAATYLYGYSFGSLDERDLFDTNTIYPSSPGTFV